MFNVPKSTEIEIRTYAEIINGGGVVAFPTETVYGLGASAWNPEAIAKVFELKGRPSDNPLIVHIANYGMLLNLAAEIPQNSRILMQKFWPGPLTLIFEKKSQILDAITGGLNSVAVRMPDHAFALKLIQLTGPLVAPSANISGKPSPTKSVHVISDFGKSIPVLDGGSCVIGLESTVLDVRAEPFKILRPGRITSKMIFERTGIQVIEADLDEIFETTDTPVSPGMKYKHYAPNANVRWMTGTETDGNLSTDKVLYLTQNQFTLGGNSKGKLIVFNNDLDLMANEIYDWFRVSDLEGYTEIAIQPFDMTKESDIGTALHNRIAKAIQK